MIKIQPKQTMLEGIPEKNLRMRRRTLKIVKMMIRRMKKNQRKTEIKKTEIKKTEIKKMKIKKKRKMMVIKKKIQVFLIFLS